MPIKGIFYFRLLGKLLFTRFNFYPFKKYFRP